MLPHILLFGNGQDRFCQLILTLALMPCSAQSSLRAAQSCEESTNSVMWQGKGAEKGDPRLDSEAEAHLCQLAMMENFAAHGMYVKFSDDEARNLEERSIQLAIRESKDEEEALRYTVILLLSNF